MVSADIKKLDGLLRDVRNGNLAQARTTVLSLTKLQIAELLINHHQLPHGFIGEVDTRIRFENFLIETLKWVRR